MYATKLFLVITSVLSTIVSAGPHARGLDRRIRRVVHRRHHTRRSPEGAILAGRGGCDEGTAVGTVGNLVANATTPETYTLVCTEGDWQCSGISLQGLRIALCHKIFADRSQSAITTHGSPWPIALAQTSCAGMFTRLHVPAPCLSRLLPSRGADDTAHLGLSDVFGRRHLRLYPRVSQLPQLQRPV